MKSHPKSPSAKRWRAAGTKSWRALNSKGLCELDEDENQDVSRCMQMLADQREVVHECGSLADLRQTFPGWIQLQMAKTPAHSKGKC